jgi:hypothetical protein
MRKRTVAALAASAALGATIAMAPTASAEPNPPNCPKGYFCAYSAHNSGGSQTIRTAGNWTGSIDSLTLFNNGVVYPGADHVSVDVVTFTKERRTICLHYNPGPGAYKVNVADGANIRQVTWRGECTVEGWRSGWYR